MLIDTSLNTIDIKTEYFGYCPICFTHIKLTLNEGIKKAVAKYDLKVPEHGCKGNGRVPLSAYREVTPLDKQGNPLKDPAIYKFD